MRGGRGAGVAAASRAAATARASAAIEHGHADRGPDLDVDPPGRPIDTAHVGNGSRHAAESIVADADVLVVGGGLAGLVAARDLTEAGPARHRPRGARPARRADLDDDASRAPTSMSSSAAPGSIPRASRRSPPRSSATASRCAPTASRASGSSSPAGSVTRARAATPACATRSRPSTPRSRRSGDGSPMATARPALERLADLDVSVTEWLARQSVPTALARRRCWPSPRRWAAADPSELAFLPLVLDAIDNGYAIDAGWSEIGVSFVGGTRDARRCARRRPRCPARAHRGRDRGRRRRGDGPPRRWRTADRPCRDRRPAAQRLARRRVRPAADRRQGAARPTRGHAGHSSKVLAVARNIPDGLGRDRLGRAAPGDLLDGRRGRRRRAAARRLRRPRRPIDPNDRDAVTDAIRRYVPDAEIVAHGGHDWNADRFSKGAWFAPPAGWHRTTMGEDLEAPVGRRRVRGRRPARGRRRAGSKARSRAAAARRSGSPRCSPRAVSA